MHNSTRRFTALGAAALLALGAPASALAGGHHCPPPPPPKKSKCNAGNGNGSESLAPSGHCYMGDPGNSYNAGNRGGDEIPSSHGRPNPGGNNVN
jgi:hypothetical protein